MANRTPGDNANATTPTNPATTPTPPTNPDRHPTTNDARFGSMNPADAQPPAPNRADEDKGAAWRVTLKVDATTDTAPRPRGAPPAPPAMRHTVVLAHRAGMTEEDARRVGLARMAPSLGGLSVGDIGADGRVRLTRGAPRTEAERRDASARALLAETFGSVEVTRLDKARGDAVRDEELTRDASARDASAREAARGGTTEASAREAATPREGRTAGSAPDPSTSAQVTAGTPRGTTTDARDAATRTRSSR